jgi:Ni,Fe-hydrogenase III large subunit
MPAWTEFRNLQAVPLIDIPRLPPGEFRGQLVEGAAKGWRPVLFFGDCEPGGTALYAVMSDDGRSRLSGAATVFKAREAYPAITPDVPAFHMFEREFYEEFGIEPKGHPWLKPVRRGIAGSLQGERPYPFFRMDGDEVHEVGVGPIHAGVIEPGHFRFSCQGEDVHHLEIQLGFQHRGVEGLFLTHRDRPGYLIHLAESIVGDSVIGHAGAFAAALESLGRITLGRRAMIVRVIAQELERIGAHLGDLSALAGDIAYAAGNAAFGALRTKAINTTLALCGSRFGRGLISVGGVRFGLSAEGRNAIRKAIDAIESDAELAARVLFESSSVLARFEKTGIVFEETARRLGLVGTAARASGLARDVRADHPYGGYAFFPIHKMTLDSGDVFARAYLRHVEIGQSARIIREQLDAPGAGELAVPSATPSASTLVVSLAEGWRGEIAHAALTDAEGRLKRYKIKDPSFHNWFGLAMAVRKNGISDFPLCNKSFNLSYCGFDL